MITCKEAVARLWIYLDRNLGKAEERELEAHLGLCRHCCGELEFARQIRERLRAGGAVAVDRETRARLEGFLERLTSRRLEER
ncbi:MAG TPA: zf-HC2 domain-containing protein [bacterium]|nr:zf-HC2 domain-containing protein [bacterium]